MAISTGAFLAGSLGSSLIGLGGNIFGSILGNNMSKHSAMELAVLQYNLQRKLNQHAYQDTTHSMREAGINPMLAIGNGASAGSVGLGSSQTQAPSFDLDLMSAISTAKQLKMEQQRVNNETDVSKSTVRKQEYEGDLAHENSALINQQNRLLNTYGDVERQLQLVNTAKQGALLDKQMQDINNQMLNRNLMTNSAVSLNRSYGYNASQSGHSAKQNAINQEKYNQWIEKHPILYSVGNIKLPQGVNVGAHAGKVYH